MVKRGKRKGYLDYRIRTYGAAMILVAGGGIALAPLTKGISIFVCMPFFHSLWKKQRPFVLGKKGERVVQKHLRRILPSSVTVLNDVILRRSDASETQIDHLIVGLGGCMVIETKNWSGTIYVRPYEKYWIQQTTTGSSFEVYSPTRQNYGHIMAVQEFLNHAGQDVPVSGMVVFAGDSVELRGEQTGEQPVAYLKDVALKHFEPILQSDVECAAERAQSLRSTLTQNVRI